eukprot:6721685-Prymnesium_polylepis.1
MTFAVQFCMYTMHQSRSHPPPRSYVDADAGGGLAAGSTPARKSATTPPLHPTRVLRASA